MLGRKTWEKEPDVEKNREIQKVNTRIKRKDDTGLTLVTRNSHL